MVTLYIYIYDSWITIDIGYMVHGFVQLKYTVYAIDHISNIRGLLSSSMQIESPNLVPLHN